MALTATAQSALPPDPSWDETIVPALRKRLESESRILAKRMSVASTTSLEEAAVPTYPTPYDGINHDRSKRPTYVRQTSKGSGSSSQTSTQTRSKGNPSAARVNGGSGNGRVSPKNPTYTRKRTKSQPFPVDLPPLPTGDSKRAADANGGALPTPANSRSNSPMIVSQASDIKPTRIPMVARVRTGSMSSHAQNPANHGGSESHNGKPSPYNSPNFDVPSDVWAADEGTNHHFRSNASTIHTQHSRIMNEPAPFPSSTTASSLGHGDFYEMPSRPSAESEEHPFEHWYRGETSRNGGVGELRVAKRMEMLDIANYGHSIRRASPSRMPSVVGDTFVDTSKRRRADSLSRIGPRESFYMDETGAQENERVMDEAPLTDLDGEGNDTDIENTYVYQSRPSHTVTSSKAEISRSETPTRSRAPSRQQTAPPSRIPAPSVRNSSDVPPSTPTRTSRGEAGLPSSASRSRTQSSTAGVPRSPPTPQKPQLDTPEASKRHAKSPAVASTASSSKKAKGAIKRYQDDDGKRGSIAQYPVPPDQDNIIHAIPSWTQPVSDGNWDDVVLPVVARKKGLDGKYQQADGSPKPRPPAAKTIEPAPGTFGFDHSKYRSPGEDVEMDEFGQQLPENDASRKDEADHPGSPKDSWKESRHASIFQPPVRSASPAPFSHYVPNGQTDRATMPSSWSQPSVPSQRQVEDDKDDDAGCCKCVIM